MKNTSRFLGITAFAAVVVLLSAGCASTQTASPGGMTLDRAIADAATRIDGRIPAGSKIALLNFTSPSDRFSLYVLDELSANLLDSGKLIVVDRREIDLIRTEIDFQYSGEVADDSMQAVGRRLGAQSIVSGSLAEIGRNMYRVVFRVLNVETAVVEVHHRANIVADSLVLALLEGGRTSPTGSPQHSRAAQTPVTLVVQPAVQAPVEQTGQVEAPQPVATPATAPVVVAQAPEPRLANGTRTFHPRPQAYQGARAVHAFVEYVVVRNEYMTIRIRPGPTGDVGAVVGGTNINMFGFREWSRVQLQDLDRPERTFTPVQGDQTRSNTWNRGGWLTFRNVNATRFSLTCVANSPRVVFDEIRLGAPD